MALIPGLLELFELAEEIRQTPGAPERARNRAERIKDIASQLLQHRRLIPFSPEYLQDQLQQLEDLALKGYSGERILRLPAGEITFGRQQHGSSLPRGVISVTERMTFRGYVEKNVEKSRV